MVKSPVSVGPAPDLLAEYFALSGVAQAELARAIGVSDPTMTNYMQRLRRPRDIIRRKIAVATCGHVPVPSWESADDLATIRAVKQLGKVS